MAERKWCKNDLHELTEGNLKPMKDRNGKVYMICRRCRNASQKKYDEGRKGQPRRDKVKQC